MLFPYCRPNSETLVTERLCFRERAPCWRTKIEMLFKFRQRVSCNRSNIILQRCFISSSRVHGLCTLDWPLPPCRSLPTQRSLLSAPFASLFFTRRFVRCPCGSTGQRSRCDHNMLIIRLIRSSELQIQHFQLKTRLLSTAQAARTAPTSRLFAQRTHLFD